MSTPFNFLNKLSSGMGRGDVDFSPLEIAEGNPDINPFRVSTVKSLLSVDESYVDAFQKWPHLHQRADIIDLCDLEVVVYNAVHTIDKKLSC
jgi:hypothetical protein